MESKYTPGSGPIGAKLMIIRECPTVAEMQSGHLKFDKDTVSVLLDAKIKPQDVWHTTLSKYPIVPNTRGTKKIPFAVRCKITEVDVYEQLRELQEEINEIKPNCILGLGESVLWALTGKKDIGFNRGSILLGMGRKFVPTFNPSHLNWQAAGAEFKGYFNRYLMVFDAKRALAQSRFEELIRPSRTLEICTGSAHLAMFYERYKHLTKVSVDIEADQMCVPACIGLAFTKSHGMTVPLWNENGMSTIPDVDMIQVWLLLDKILTSHDIIGQNFRGYDNSKINTLGFTIRHVASDTMMKAFAINPELSVGLASNISIYTEEPAYKDDGMYRGSFSDLLTGCARDACVTLEVDEVMDSDLDEIGQRKFYENFLMKLPELYEKIQNQGFNVDSKRRLELMKKYIEWDEQIRLSLFQLVGTEVNVNSPKQVATLLFDNLKLPYKDTTGEEDLTELLNNKRVSENENIKQILELILEGRKVRKTISTYIMALPDFDGRMKTTYFLCLNTGRTSTGQQDPPIRPTIELRDDQNKLKHRVLGTAFQTMTKHGDIGPDIRGMYIPDKEDEVFIQADSAQAEARVIFLLADDEQALLDIDEHDYHALTASWFFGGTENDYSKKVLGYEHPIRFCGKTLRHAGHLGASKRRAAISVNTDARKYKIPITITEAIAEQALTIFHAKQPKIQQVFQAQVIECLKRNRVLIAPLPYGIDSPVGGRRTFYERYGEELFRQAYAYLPQRAISDNTKAAALRIVERIPEIKIVMESHDALLFCIPKSRISDYVPIIKGEMERPIDFSRCSLPRRELVIPCEIEIGTNYSELSKFRDNIPKLEEFELPPIKTRSAVERFTAVRLPEDTKRDNDIYYHTVEKKQFKRSFYIDE